MSVVLQRGRARGRVQETFSNRKVASLTSVEMQARPHAAGYEFTVDWLLGRDPRAMTLDELQLQIRAINIRNDVLNSQLPCPGAWQVLLGTLVHR